MRTSRNICAYQNVRFQSKYMRTSWNICAYPKYLLTCKISAHIKNIRAHEIFAPMKCSRLWNIRAYLKYLRIYKIYAPHPECSRLIIYDSNKAAVEIFAPYKRCMRPENRRPNSYYLGSAESPTSDSFSVWLKSSRSGDVASLPCSPQMGSALRPPSLYGRRLCRTVLTVVPARPAKIFAPCQMFAARIFPPFFWEKSKT